MMTKPELPVAQAFCQSEDLWKVSNQANMHNGIHNWPHWNCTVERHSSIELKTTNRLYYECEFLFFFVKNARI